MNAPNYQDHRSFPSTRTLLLLVAVMTLLMAFSTVAWLLGNTALATVAGLGACTVATDIARRYLGSGTSPNRHHTTPSSPIETSPPELLASGERADPETDSKIVDRGDPDT